MEKEFFDAIRAGDMEKVKRLLNQDPSLIRAREKGLSPVLVAAYHLEPGLAEFLADKTASLDIFEAAAIGRTTHLVRTLARHPEQVNTFSKDGFQPLGLACFFGHFDAADYLIRAGASVNTPSDNPLQVTPLHSAVAGGHIRIVELLLKKGAQPNVRERGGYTPLHTAAANGDVESIRLLILAGANLHLRSDDGKIALHLAEEKKHSKAVDLLKQEITRRLRME